MGTVEDTAGSPRRAGPAIAGPGAALRPRLAGFWRWWTQALATWLPQRLRELFGLARELNVEAEGIEIGPAPVEQVITDELSMSINDLDLSVRSYNCLMREGITTVSQLVALSESQLMNIRNFGQKSVDEVREKLSALGLSLKDSVPGFEGTHFYGAPEDSGEYI